MSLGVAPDERAMSCSAWLSNTSPKVKKFFLPTLSANRVGRCRTGAAGRLAGSAACRSESRRCRSGQSHTDRRESGRAAGRSTVSICFRRRKSPTVSGRSCLPYSPCSAKEDRFCWSSERPDPRNASREGLESSSITAKPGLGDPVLIAPADGLRSRCVIARDPQTFRGGASAASQGITLVGIDASGMVQDDVHDDGRDRGRARHRPSRAARRPPRPNGARRKPRLGAEKIVDAVAVIPTGRNRRFLRTGLSQMAPAPSSLM